MDMTQRIGPYVGISKQFRRGRYIIAIYGAYDAYGLIGTECNGIVVLDDEDRLVVADALARSPDGGWFGPSKEQLRVADWLRVCTPAEFADYINTSGRNRHDVDPDNVPAGPKADPMFELLAAEST